MYLFKFLWKTFIVVSIFWYGIYSFYTNIFVNEALNALPKQWVISILLKDNKQFNKENMQETIKKTIIETYNKIKDNSTMHASASETP